MTNRIAPLLALSFLALACEAEEDADLCEVANAEHLACFDAPLPDVEAGTCSEDFAAAFLEAGCSTPEEVEASAGEGKADSFVGRAGDLIAVAEGSIVPPPHSRLAAFRSAWEVGANGTVGRGVAGCIAGIYMLWGAEGERGIGNVFRSAEARALMANGNWDVGAHRALAQMEYSYWEQEHRANPDFYTAVATAVSVDNRVALQVAMGDIASLKLLLQAADWRIPPYFSR